MCLQWTNSSIGGPRLVYRCAGLASGSVSYTHLRAHETESFGNYVSRPSRDRDVETETIHSCPHLTHCGQAEAYLHTMCHLDSSSRLATIDRGRKFGLRPFWGRGAGSPSNAMSPGLRPISLPSGILIHPAVWPQIDTAENWGLCFLFGEGELGPQ